MSISAMSNANARFENRGRHKNDNPANLEGAYLSCYVCKFEQKMNFLQKSSEI